MPATTKDAARKIGSRAKISGAARPRVLVADPIDAEGIAILREDCEVEGTGNLSPEAVLKALPGAEAIIVRSRTQMTAEMIEAGTNLRVIGRAGIGVDNIDVEAATRRGILVLNTPASSTLTTAEHTLALLFALARNVVPAALSLRAGEWKREAFTGVDLHEKTLGVVGLGRIGSEVARQAKSLRMRVVAYDPIVPAEYVEKIGVERMGLDRLVAESDFITLHIPLTKETRHLIGAPEFGRMKPGARLLNCARGGLVDEKALLAALDSGRVAGAALDVFEEEPVRENPLASHPKVVATPHLGASTHEAQKLVSLDVARQVLAALRGESTLGAVNLPFLPPETLKRIQPYLRLSERIGALLAQAGPVSVRRVEVLFAGEIKKEPTHLLAKGVLVGLLRDVVEGGVTLVNADLLARQRAIELVESQSDSSPDYHSLVTARTMGDGEYLTVTATVVGLNDPRVLRVDDFPIDFRPEGTILLTRHEDRPGVVARVTAILAEAAINISEMQLGRDRVGGQAMMTVGVDGPLPDGIIEKVRALPGIRFAKVVQF